MVATRAGVELETHGRETEVRRFEYDRDATPPSVAVAAALSEVTGTEPTQLEPLHEFVDTDALDELLGRESAGTVSVTLTGAGYVVTLNSQGQITVAPPVVTRTGTRDGNGSRR